MDVGVTNQRPSSDSELISRMGIRLLACVTRTCEQVLLGALAAGREKEGELATMSLNLNSISNSPVAPRRLSCQISAKQQEAETSANVNKH